METPPAGASGAAGPRLSGVPPAATAAEAARPRDSFGSVLSVGPGLSSPVVAIEEEAETGVDADEHMHGYSGSNGPRGIDGELRALQAEWRARDVDEQDLHLLAQSYMRSHELLRAAHVLRECSGPKARWTRCYARFMVSPRQTPPSARPGARSTASRLRFSIPTCASDPRRARSGSRKRQANSSESRIDRNRTRTRKSCSKNSPHTSPGS